MDENSVFTILNDKGEEIECEVLFTFESEETGKNYMVYTDNSKDENDNIKVFASIYNPSDEVCELIPIESDEEWKIIETILDSIQDVKEN